MRGRGLGKGERLRAIPSTRDASRMSSSARSSRSTTAAGSTGRILKRELARRGVRVGGASEDRALRLGQPVRRQQAALDAGIHDARRVQGGGHDSLVDLSEWMLPYQLIHIGLLPFSVQADFCPCERSFPNPAGRVSMGPRAVSIKIEI